MHEERHGRCTAPSASWADEAITYGVTVLSALFALALLTPQAMAQGCPLVAKPPVLAHETVSQAIDGRVDPDEEIHSIQVTVVTGTGLFSGTTDDVWLDLGPRAWKLGEQFEEGSTKTFALNVYDPYFEGAGSGRLRIRDLIYARIEKKGICGLTNAPDSLLDLAFPGGATPANLLPSVRALIEQAGSLRDIESAVNLAIDTKNALQNKVIDIQGRIRRMAQQIESGAIKKSDEIVEKVACPGFIPTFLNPACLIEKKREQLTQQFIDAQSYIAGLQGQLDDLSKQVANAETAVEKATADKAHALATLQASLADKAVQFGLDRAGPTLDKLQEVARELDDLVKKAAAGLSVPQPGQWNLQSISMAINGKHLLSFQIEGGRLKRDQPSVTYYFRHLSPADLFVYGLRANINKQSAHSDEAAAGITTTFFKDNNISGWESRPLSYATVTGILRHPPSPGTDGYVSLDLQVDKVMAQGRQFDLGQWELPRYIRIEYIHRTDTRYADWPVGAAIEVSGPVEWDTDQYGFYELHPNRASQVAVISQQAPFTNIPGISQQAPLTNIPGISQQAPLTNIPGLSPAASSRLGFRSRFSRGYRPRTWHVIVGSFPSEEAAQAAADNLNWQYPTLFFEEAQSNDNKWMVTLGSGIGKSDADLLLSVARNAVNVRDAYEYCWGVFQKNWNRVCAP